MTDDVTSGVGRCLNILFSAFYFSRRTRGEGGVTLHSGSACSYNYRRVLGIFRQHSPPTLNRINVTPAPPSPPAHLANATSANGVARHRTQSYQSNRQERFDPDCIPALFFWALEVRRSKNPCRNPANNLGQNVSCRLDGFYPAPPAPLLQGCGTQRATSP